MLEKAQVVIFPGFFPSMHQIKRMQIKKVIPSGFSN